MSPDESLGGQLRLKGEIMKVFAIKCKKCGDTVYSRATHDFRWCSCKSAAIDGGQEDYVKITGEPENIESMQINIDETREMLYNDWNKRIDKLGIIKEK